MRERYPRPWLRDDQETRRMQCLSSEAHPAHASVQAYVSFYDLSWSEVARAAGLLLIVLWRVTRALPVSAAHAAALREGLFRLTGIAYTGPIATFPPEQRSQVHRPLLPGQSSLDRNDR